MFDKMRSIKTFFKAASLILTGMLLLTACMQVPAAQPQPTPILPLPTAAPAFQATQMLPTAIPPEPPTETAATDSPQATESSLPVTGAAVRLVDDPKFGKILVDANGMTLYTFAIDTDSESQCVQSDCVAFWPPYLVEGQPAAGPDLPGNLSTITRPDGTQQLAYNGRPLYTFKLDQKPGDVNGDGIVEFGGAWHVAAASGMPDEQSKQNTPVPDNSNRYSY